MNKGRIEEHARGSKCGRRARTNAGMFIALTADYRAGRLSPVAERRYEDMVATVWSLYREAQS